VALPNSQLFILLGICSSFTSLTLCSCVKRKCVSQSLQIIFPRWASPFYCKFLHFGIKGGLPVSWKLGIEIKPILLNRHQISFLVYSNPPSSPWLVSCIHPPSIWNLLRNFWKDLNNDGNRFGSLWVLIGDFNAILSLAENKGGRVFQLFFSLPVW
jgi:hypothetical protein